jgi:hypothetical protein
MLPHRRVVQCVLTDGGKVKGALTGVWGWCGGRGACAADGVVLVAQKIFLADFRVT